MAASKPPQSTSRTVSALLSSAQRSCTRVTCRQKEPMGTRLCSCSRLAPPLQASVARVWTGLEGLGVTEVEVGALTLH